MTLEELRSCLPVLTAEPEQLAAAVAGLDTEALDFRPEPRKWSIRQIVAHLADMEILYAYRMRQMLADKSPTIAPIDQDDWADHLHYDKIPIADSLDFFRSTRLATVRMLSRIEADDLKRSAYHPEHQRQVTLAELCGMMVGHVQNHLGQIERLKRLVREQAIGA
jgi:hypothetical protein